MQRVVYCPSAQELPEAEKIGAEYGIPIVVGMCPAIEDLDFDTTNTQLLLIPTDQFFSVSSIVARLGKPFSATYVDEMTPVNNVWLEIVDKTGALKWRQDPELGDGNSPYAFFRISFTNTGDYRLSIVDPDGLIAYEDVSVVL